MVTSTTQVSGIEALIIMETMIDLIAMVSNGTLSFIFALLMNFILLFFIFSINLTSGAQTDLMNALEVRRMGGRETNELELNRFAHKI